MLPRGPAKRSVGSFVAGFKSAVTTRINTSRHTPGKPIWQRNYYERIVRDDTEMARLREYIAGNPAAWAEDAENPATRKPYAAIAARTNHRNW